MIAINIPGRILRVLDQYANVAFAGTRDRDLVPYGHRVTGWVVEPGGQSMTAFVAEHSTEKLVESLEANGEFALTVEEFPSHETYQFKGRYRAHRPMLPEDHEVGDRIRERFAKSVRHVQAEAPEHMLKAFVLPAALAVEFDVGEIFLQTP